MVQAVVQASHRPSTGTLCILTYPESTCLMGFSLFKPPTLDIRMKMYKTYAPRGIYVLTIVAMTVAADLNARAQETKELMENDAMLQPWSGPYGGVPPWHLVRPDEFVDAFDAAIELAEPRSTAIADNPDPPTFANTIVALETAGPPARSAWRRCLVCMQSNLNVGPIAGHRTRRRCPSWPSIETALRRTKNCSPGSPPSMKATRCKDA